MRNMFIPFICMFLLAFLGTVLPLWSKDFADMSFRELFIYRSTVTDASAEEQEAFEREWKKRVQSMTDVEREQIEKLERSKKFPNPYVQGRGYDNQGTNAAIFEDDLKRSQEGSGEDRQ